MSEIIKVEPISRREAFSLLGLTAALGFAVPITLLAESNAEAQDSDPDSRADHCPGGERRDVGHAAASRPARCSP